MSVPVELYFDVHVPRAIARALRERGINVLRSQEDGTSRFEDPALLDRAHELKRVLFSQDADLLAEAAMRQRSNIEFSGVIYAQQLAVSIGQCIADLELLAKACIAEEFRNRVQYLPLR